MSTHDFRQKSICRREKLARSLSVSPTVLNSGPYRLFFFSSDRNHLPWHIKNLFMNVLFDQGSVGLLLFSAMLLAALWRVSVGTAKDHPLAPGIGGGLVGFVVVGLFDSLVDVPRLAFGFYVVLLLGLTVRQASAPRLPTASRH